MLKLGRAQGVAIAAAMSANLSVTEYSPKKVKQSITGNGNADKEQVWKMLQRILLSANPGVLMKGRNIMMPQMPWQSRSVITFKATALPNQMGQKRKRETKKLAGKNSLNNILTNFVYRFERIFCCTFFNDSSEALSLSCVKFRSLDVLIGIRWM